jgi:hypothetical protein
MNYCQDDDIKEHNTAREYNIDVRSKKYVQNIVPRIWKEETPFCNVEVDVIKQILKRKRIYSCGRIHPVEDRNQWREIASMVRNIDIP